jgi:DNA polymerase-3 subunit delta
VTPPVILLKGSDDVLRGEALSRVLHDLVGDGDRSLLVDEFDLDVTTLGAAIDAAQTIPFLTDRRIVVVRRFGRFSKGEEVAGLVDYLADPLDTTALVLVWEKSVKATETGESVAAKPAVPQALTKAVKAAGGEVVDPSPSGKLDAWVPGQLRDAGLDVDPRAVKLIVDTLGDDAGGIVELIGRLKGAHEPGSRLGVEEVQALLGRAGGVAPWDLTDAIDRGDPALAIDQLHRMLEGGDRHPLAIMATLQSHYLRMLKLDGAGARGEKEAAQVLGLKGSTFPAKKALAQANALGSARIRRAVALVAGADVDLRGARAWPGELVMEVLVARLARLSGAR